MKDEGSQLMEDPRTAMQDALKGAMKQKDVQRRDAIRMALNAVKQVEIDSQKQLSAEETLDVLQREAKRRRESIDEYRQAGRDDLADAESAELDVLMSFLPQQLSADEVRAIVDDVIAETGATSPKDTGKVMGLVMQRVKGVADGKLVNLVVREQLNARSS
jgi:uncharacterized protein